MVSGKDGGGGFRETDLVGQILRLITKTKTFLFAGPCHTATNFTAVSFHNMCFLTRLTCRVRS